MDKRKFNGGNSTKSIKQYDRRKRISVSDTESFNSFFNRMKEDMMVFYESAYKGFLDTHIKHGEYYVYFHYLNGNLVYIGKGKNERFNQWKSRINGEHSNLLKDGFINEVIIANNLNEEIALLIEESLIKNLKPKYNISHNG
jgi:hypothetical protein